MCRIDFFPFYFHLAYYRSYNHRADSKREKKSQAHLSYDRMIVISVAKDLL